jgi:hypothetical protein
MTACENEKGEQEEEKGGRKKERGAIWLVMNEQGVVG